MDVPWKNGLTPLGCNGWFVGSVSHPPARRWTTAAQPIDPHRTTRRQRRQTFFASHVPQSPPGRIFGPCRCAAWVWTTEPLRNRYAPARLFCKKPPVVPDPPADSACSIRRQPIGRFLHLQPRPIQPSPAVVVAGQFAVIDPDAVLVAVRRIGCDHLVSSGPDQILVKAPRARADATSAAMA